MRISHTLGLQSVIQIMALLVKPKSYAVASCIVLEFLRTSCKRSDENSFAVESKPGAPTSDQTPRNAMIFLTMLIVVSVLVIIVRIFYKRKWCER